MKGLVIFLFALVFTLTAKTFIVETYDANTPIPKKHISRGKRLSFFEDKLLDIPWRLCQCWSSCMDQKERNNQKKMQLKDKEKCEVLWKNKKSWMVSKSRNGK